MTWLAHPLHQYCLPVCQNVLKALGVCVLKVTLNMRCSNSKTSGEIPGLVHGLIRNSSMMKELFTFKLHAKRNCPHEVGLLKCTCSCHSPLRALISPGKCGCEHIVPRLEIPKAAVYSATAVLETKVFPRNKSIRTQYLDTVLKENQ